MPAVAKGLVSVCAIVDPFDALAPVIPPVIVPSVQLKIVPVTLLFNVILVAVSLQNCRWACGCYVRCRIYCYHYVYWGTGTTIR